MYDIIQIEILFQKEGISFLDDFFDIFNQYRVSKLPIFKKNLQRLNNIDHITLELSNNNYSIFDISIYLLPLFHFPSSWSFFSIEINGLSPQTDSLLQFSPAEWLIKKQNEYKKTKTSTVEIKEDIKRFKNTFENLKTLLVIDKDQEEKVEKLLAICEKKHLKRKRSADDDLLQNIEKILEKHNQQILEKIQATLTQILTNKKIKV